MQTPSATLLPTHRNSSGLWLCVVALACVLGAGTWLLVSHLSPGRALQGYPETPDLQSQPTMLANLIRSADAEARRQPASALGLGRLGMIYHSNQLYSQAESAYRLAAQLAPGDYRWPYLRSLVERENGNEDAELALLKEALRLKPDYVPASTKVGDILFKRDQLEEAGRYYEQSTTSVQAAFGLGRIAARRQQWAGVIAFLAPIASRHPSFRPPHQLLAEAYENTGAFDKAAEERRVLLRPNLTVVPPAEDGLAQELLELCCSSTRLLKEAGFLSRFGDSEQVLRLARRAVEVEPLDADARHFLCRTLLKSHGANPKAAAEALGNLTEGLRLRPGDLNPLLTVADIFFSQKKTDAAIEQLRLLLAKSGGSAQAHYYLGVATEHQGKRVEALSHYRNALKSDPTYAEPHLRLGLACIREGNFAQGIEYLRRAVRLKPTFTLAHYNLGLALEQQKDFRGAMLEYAEVLQLEPDDAAAHMNLGLLLAQLGRFAEATSHFRETVRIMPDDAEARYDLGCSLASEGKTDAAKAEFREALRLQPDYPDASTRLRELAGMGRHPE